MPPLPHDNVSKLEAGQSKGLEEKSSSEHVGGSSSRIGRTEDSNNRAPMERMPSAGRLLVTLLLSFLVTFGLATALSPRDWHRRAYQRGDAVREHIGMEAEEDGVSFTSLLQAASPNSLHDLLHKYFPERFKDGVWESDASAVEAVRRVDAVLAASIVQLARRADNGTTTSPTSTTPPPPDSTTTDAPPTTTPPPDGGTGTSTEPSNTAPPPTSSNPPGQTSTTTTRGSSSTTTVPPSSSRTTTTGRSNTSPGTSTSADSTRPSSSPATSSTTHSSSFVTASHSGPLSSSISRGGTSNPTTGKPTFTSAPSPRPVTSTFTSTMDNGGVVVITTTSFVNPDPAVTGPSSTRPTPTLQNAAPAKFSHGPGALSVVVVAGVALLI